MDSDEVSLPLIHEHLMVSWNDLRKGNCCGRFKSISDGFYCRSCDFFVHKECAQSSEYIEHPSHSHTLRLQIRQRNICNLCSRRNLNLFYRCEMCDFDVDLSCIKYPPPKVIDISEKHNHKLQLTKELIWFDCSECGKVGGGFPYTCHESCDIAFHVDCIWNPTEAKHSSEVNHNYHPLHPLKLHTGQPPEYSDGQCRLCERKIDDKLFYHCSACNFSLDMRCVLNPQLKSILNSKAHDHQLTLLPRLISFVCNACGFKGDRSPYVCYQCDFMIHQKCLFLPHIININRHDHRVCLTSNLGVVNSVCGICLQKMDWTYGGYSCMICQDYVVHSRCATRIDVWNGKELEGIPEHTDNMEPYMVQDDNTIQHFSHEDHYLRLVVNGNIWEENKQCSACMHPIGLQSFYNCIDCDFFLHQNCAGFLRKKWHMSYKEQLTLVTSKANAFDCSACGRMSNGFRYQLGRDILDVRCGTMSDPFFHPSHHHHPLFYSRLDKRRHCNGCNELTSSVLTCATYDCDFQLDFKCATLPFIAKNSIYDDHPFSLCYGKEASGKHWCGICEKEININTWFYTCKDQHDTLHISCVVGDFSGLMPTSTIEVSGRSFEVVLNNSVCRPFCICCKLRSVHPIMLKMLGTSDIYVCSNVCLKKSAQDPNNAVVKEIQNPNMQESM